MQNLLKLGRQKIVKDCDVKRHRLVAIAFSRSGCVIATATNRKGEGYISDYSFHAEEFLVRKLRKIKARERYGAIRVLVARLSKTGWASAAPCPGCRKILADYGIKDIWFTDRLTEPLQGGIWKLGT